MFSSIQDMVRDVVVEEVTSVSSPSMEKFLDCTEVIGLHNTPNQISD